MCVFLLRFFVFETWFSFIFAILLLYVVEVTFDICIFFSRVTFARSLNFYFRIRFSSNQWWIAKICKTKYYIQVEIFVFNSHSKWKLFLSIPMIFPTIERIIVDFAWMEINLKNSQRWWKIILWIAWNFVFHFRLCESECSKQCMWTKYYEGAKKSAFATDEWKVSFCLVKVCLTHRRAYGT